MFKQIQFVVKILARTVQLLINKQDSKWEDNYHTFMGERQLYPNLCAVGQE